MDTYHILVIALLVLAAADVMVGVSNDAVNFMNSAIGSKVAPLYVILIVASLGVFLGASMSDGMMEIARKGIFNPEYFTFQDLMVVFVAVMISDILLLDFFNTLGLPTSTTVSIVFELLGASLAVGLLALYYDPSRADSIWEMLNVSKATQVIFGIFVSIGIAFTVGAIVQWFTRLLFTFRFEKNLKTFGPPFAAVSIAVIVYFALVKGLKGAVFLTTEQADYINNNALLIIAFAFVISLILVIIIQRFLNYNPLKVVVLMGTFALAMAFAGNDLVNFIGVPIAAYEAYDAWQASGVGPGEFRMEMLAEKVKTNPLFLFASGAIMVATLWLSGKAFRVVETEVNLGSQTKVNERFKPNALSRGIVHAADKLGKKIDSKIPRKTNAIINWRFRTLIDDTEGAPAFDLVRASVNLMVAAILISFATSLKLPLSTTYVTFMVAMGTSIADRAWGAGSAVYRVAGVLKVIGGWFMTALVAATSAGIVATIIYFGGNYVSLALFAVAAVVLIVSNRPRKDKRKTAGRKKFK